MNEFDYLLSAAKQGDKNAILKIIEMYKPALLKNSMVNNQFDEDLYQQLISVALRCIQTFHM